MMLHLGLLRNGFIQGGEKLMRSDRWPLLANIRISILTEVQATISTDFPPRSFPLHDMS